MAFNLNALKGLFSKLKPAAKTVANYGDDAMRFANSVDEHLLPYSQYDSIVQHGAIPSKLDNLLGTTKYSDVLDGKASHDGLFSLTPSNSDYFDGTATATRMPSVAEDLYNASLFPGRAASELDLSKLQHNVDDLVGTPYTYRGGTVVVRGDGTGRYGYDAVPDRSVLTRLDSHYVHPDWTVAPGADGKLHTVRKDDLAELDSLSQLDPDAYTSGLDGTPPSYKDSIIAPEAFGGREVYDNRLVGSFSYPDGFLDPDAAAMYYDSLERGYVPVEYLDAGLEMRFDKDRMARHAALESELGSDAFSNARLSDAFTKLNKRRLTRRP